MRKISKYAIIFSSAILILLLVVSFFYNRYEENLLLLHPSREQKVVAYFNVTSLIVILITISCLALFSLYHLYKKKLFYKNLLLKAEALCRTRGEFQATLYSIGDAVITTDISGSIIHMNIIAESLTGWKEVDAKGKSIDNVFRIVNEETKMKVSNPVSRVIREGKVIGVANHTLLISKEGTTIPISDNAPPILDENKEMLGVVLVFRDQTEERKKQAELRESRDRFLSLYENINEGVALHEVIFDEKNKPINYRLIDVNPRYERILDVKKYAVVGKLATEVYRTDVAPYMEEFCTVAINKETFSFETYFPPMDRFFEISVVPWSTSGFATIFTDISKRKRAEQEIRNVNERWNSTFNSILDPVTIIDSESNILQFNKEFEEFSQLKPDLIIGKKCYEIVHHQNQEFENCPLSRSKKSGLRETMEFIDQGIHYSVIVDPIKVNGKNACEYVHVIRNITEGKIYEEALRAREEDLDVTLHSIGDGVISTDVNGIINRMNPVAEDLTGWKIEEAFGKSLESIFNIVSAETRERTENPINIVLKEGRVVGLANHTILIAKDGTERQISDSAAPIKNKNGEIIGVVLVFSDVTKSYEIRKQLEENERALRESQVIAKLGSYVFDVQNGNWTSTDILDEIFGIDKHYEHTLTGWTNLIHTEERDELIDYLLNNVIGKKQKFEREYKIVRYNDQEVRWLYGLGELQLDSNSNPIKMIGVIMDITDKKENEMRIIESEERFRRVFVNSPDATILTRLDNSQIVDVNPAFETMTGFRRSEIINQLAANYGIWAHGNDWQIIYNDLLKNSFTSNKEVMLKKNDDTFISCLVSASLLTIHEDKFILLNLNDITDRINSRRELEQLKDHLLDLVDERTEDLERVNAQLFEENQKQKEYEMLLRISLENEKELNELKTRFISTISHEFRTPLTSIFSSTELIERKSKNNDDLKLDIYTHRIKKSVDYLTKLIDEVILINKADSGKLELNPDWTNLKEFCEDIIEDTAFLHKDTHKFITKYQLDDEKYLFDRKLMKFILSNLISNAQKYSPDGGVIEINIDTNETDLILTVCDEGIGIPEEDKPYLFEPFHRSKNCSTIPGTGLGLSIVKRSVDLHKGEITVSSEINRGTTFIVKIPKRREINEEHKNTHN